MVNLNTYYFVNIWAVIQNWYKLFLIQHAYLKKSIKGFFKHI